MEEKEVTTGGKFTLRGCTGAKIAAFLLCTAASIVTIIGIFECFLLLTFNMYNVSYKEVLKNSLNGTAYTELNYVEQLFYEEEPYRAVQNYLAGTNFELAIRNTQEQNSYFWTSYGSTEDYSNLYIDVWGNGYIIPGFMEETAGEREGKYYRFFLKTDFPVKDRAYYVKELIYYTYCYRYEIPVITCVSAVVAVILLIFLLCSAGRKNGREGIVLSTVNKCYTDVEIVILACVYGCGLLLLDELMNEGYIGIVALVISTPIFVVLALLAMMDFAKKAKCRMLFKHSLTYKILAWCFKVLRKVFVKLCAGASNLFEIRTIVIILAAVILCEGLGIALVGAMGGEAEAILGLWFVRTLLLVPAILYLARVCKRLYNAGEQLAEGRDNYCVDTSKMIGDMRRHGEHLNSIGLGIGKAVDARLKSEHMKTELITNVTHDLKTPLTSIINYADLINNEKSDNPAIAEYSEVLVRQSNRLKKLLDDLLEASKATTGNLEVNLEKCDAGVILSQAAAEYQSRMEEKTLDIRISAPEEPVYINADGRHLWRVFDNLLNNILKYAQENTRVYLNLTRENGKAVITFRNISNYALDISAEELQERFVRGDKSRHMEGNGLGLSIAKSLVELQGGTMEISVDGDLFKVILAFRELA